MATLALALRPARYSRTSYALGAAAGLFAFMAFGVSSAFAGGSTAANSQDPTAIPIKIL
jgi:hypothetical protein